MNILYQIVKLLAPIVGPKLEAWAKAKLKDAALDVAVASGVAKESPKQVGDVLGFDRSSVAQPQRKIGEVVIGEREVKK